MQANPEYENVTSEVCDFFRERLALLSSHGVTTDQVALDPGIGFGKALEHNIKLLRDLNKFSLVERPMLVGASRNLSLRSCWEHRSTNAYRLHLPVPLGRPSKAHKSSESTMSPRRFRQSAWPRRWRNETMDGSETNWLQYWRPIAEIGILSVAIYYTLTFFRGTRGWPIVLAFLGLLIGLLVCIGLNLKVLESLLNYFFGLSAFAALIIFQPELRRLLAGLGNLTFFGSLREQQENIEVVIQAVDRLSESRIGALVAIEQSTHLQDVVESGITIDCEATPEMIETIFFPNNAIHDGGIIIKEDRILSAACIFP